MPKTFYRVAITVAVPNQPGVGIQICEETFDLHFSAKECFGRWALGLKAGTLSLEQETQKEQGYESVLLQEVHGAFATYPFEQDEPSDFTLMPHE